MNLVWTDLASRAYEGDDIQAEFMLGQGQAAFGCRTIGFPKLRTVAIEAAANRQREPQNGLQGHEGTAVVISGPHGGATFGFLYISRVGVALKMVDGRV